jgi:hypothetical protein
MYAIIEWNRCWNYNGSCLFKEVLKYNSTPNNHNIGNSVSSESGLSWPWSYCRKSTRKESWHPWVRFQSFSISARENGWTLTLWRWRFSLSCAPIGVRFYISFMGLKNSVFSSVEWSGSRVRDAKFQYGSYPY